MPTFPGVDELPHLVERLASPDLGTSDAERIDLISGLESLKAAAAAAQARLTVAFDDSQRREQAKRGAPTAKQGLGVAGQIALARRDSAHRGGRHLGLARALVTEMPRTLSELAAGRISEWRATIVVRETAVLTAEQRSEVDAAVADRLRDLGDRGVEREVRRLAYALAPGSVMRRRSKAEADRRVSIRPAPDTMSTVTGLLPVAQGVAVHAALSQHAGALLAAGDPRSRGQIMADTFVERLTGQASAREVPVEVQLVMTDRTLLGLGDTPARIVGHGPVPAALGRSLLRAGPEARQARIWVRRLFTHPGTGELIAMESRRREFPAGLRRFLVIRDDVCRTPWCDAPIRHIDHALRSVDGGSTSADNGQGLCAACNLAKEAPGWEVTASPRGTGCEVTTRTPTGHRYHSAPPGLPGRPPRPSVSARGRSRVEEHFRRLAVPA